MLCLQNAVVCCCNKSKLGQFKILFIYLFFWNSLIIIIPTGKLTVCYLCSSLMLEQWFPQQPLHVEVCPISWATCHRKLSMMHHKPKLYLLFGILQHTYKLLHFLHWERKMRLRQLSERLLSLRIKRVQMLEIWEWDDEVRIWVHMHDSQYQDRDQRFSGL